MNAGGNNVYNFHEIITIIAIDSAMIHTRSLCHYYRHYKGVSEINIKIAMLFNYVYLYLQHWYRTVRNRLF